MSNFKQRSLLHNTIVLLVAMVVTKIIGAVFRIPLANILGGTGMGYYSSAYGLFSPLYAITASGIPTAMINLVSANVAKNRYFNAQKVKRVAIRFFSLAGLLATVVMIVLAKPFSTYVSRVPESFLPIIIIAPTILLCCAGNVYRGYFEGLNNMHPTAVVQIIEACARAIFGLTFAYGVILWANHQYETLGTVFGKEVFSAEEMAREALPYASGGAVLGVTFSEIFAFLFLYIRSKFSDGITKEKLLANTYAQPSMKIIRQLMHESMPIALSAVVMNFMSSVDILTVPRGISNSIANNKEFFMTHFSKAIEESEGFEGLGVFMYGSYTGVASSLFMLIPAIASMLDKSALPNIASAYAQHDFAKLNKNITIVFRGTLLMGLPLCFGLATMAEPIISLLYSSRPIESQIALPLVQILGWFGMFLIMAGVVFTIFQSIGRGDIPFKLMLFGITIKWLGNIFLTTVPQINIMGATLSTILSYMLVFFVGFALLKREVKLKLDFIQVFLKPFIAAIICAFSAFFLWEFINNTLGRLFSILISVGIGAIIYVILLIFTEVIGIKNIKNRQK